MRIAALTDIHGNLPALEAVLADIRVRGADRIVQLGDALSGPLWPAETAELLRSLALPCVRGNHERELGSEPARMAYASDRFTREQLGASDLEWIRGWPMTLRLGDDALLFHATPHDDDDYLLEDPASGYAQLRPEADVAARLGDARARVLVCGHTHVPRVVRLRDGRTIVNAGSVGLPAYTDDAGGFHRHENGSPHARYALVDIRHQRVEASIISVAYDWTASSARALRNGFPDWATWLSTGRA